MDDIAGKIPYDVLIRRSKNNEVRAFETDPGLFQIDSQDGIQLLRKADDLQYKAETAANRKDYRTSLDCYRDAIMLAIQVRSNCIQQATLFRGRSQIFCKLSDHSSALRDAQVAVQCMPGYIKGALHLANVLRLLKMHHDAFVVAITVLDMEPTAKVKTECVQFLVEIASEVEGSYHDLGVEGSIDSDIWQDVIGSLLKDRNMEAVLGLFSDHWTKHIISSFKAKDVNLSEVIFANMATWGEQGEELVNLFLKNGAKYQTICPNSKYPYHAALKVGLKSGRLQLFRHLYKHHKPDIAETLNKTGDSLLHVACRHEGSTRIEAIRELLNMDMDTVDVSALDSSGKMAHELLPKSDPGALLIQARLDEQVAGNSVKPQTVTSDARSNSCKCWSTDQVQEWLEQQGLGGLSEKFKSFDGRLLLELRLIKDTAPDAFCKILKDHLQISILDQLTLIGSLRLLPL